MRILDWIKSNPITAILILLVVWLGWQQIAPIRYKPLVSRNTTSTLDVYGGAEGTAGIAYDDAARTSFPQPPIDQYPPTNSTDRKVISNASISLLVDDVQNTKDMIISKAQDLGGYMVTSTISRPTESPYAQVTVRVPSERLDEALQAYKAMGIKVTYENLTGRDITDQYTDIEQRIDDLQETKDRYEAIREQATTVDELVKVTDQIVAIQKQIDTLVGQQTYLDQSAKFSRISIDLSTDELALPYAPDDVFRPAVTFKLAVRGLLTTLTNWAEAGIWIVVYGVVWVPLALVALWWLRRKR